MTSYLEPGASWRPLGYAATGLAVVAAADAVLPGTVASPVTSLLAIGVVLGTCLVTIVSARRMWTVRVDAHALAVGRERVPLADIDVDHLGSVDRGVDAGAPLLGGGWSLPRGRTGLPLRLTDGRTVLVPTRHPVRLRRALLAGAGGDP